MSGLPGRTVLLSPGPKLCLCKRLRDPRQYEYARDAADNLITCLVPSIVFKVLEVKVKTQDV